MSLIIIAVRDRMFLGMREFWFCPNLIPFDQISPKFCPNLIKFSQISPQFCPNLIKVDQTPSVLTTKSLLGNAAASPAHTALLITQVFALYRTVFNSCFFRLYLFEISSQCWYILTRSFFKNEGYFSANALIAIRGSGRQAPEPLNNFCIFQAQIT